MCRGLLEWPARIPKPRVSKVTMTTSDLVPTLCDLAGVLFPNRPLDGMSLVPVITDAMDVRPSPVFFWSYKSSRVTKRDPKPKPYIDPALQEGTTPLVKYLAGKLTRSFTNFHQPEIGEEDYAGARVILDGRNKLVLDGEKEGQVELFDLWADPAEGEEPGRVEIADGRRNEPAIAGMAGIGAAEFERGGLRRVATFLVIPSEVEGPPQLLSRLYFTRQV